MREERERLMKRQKYKKNTDIKKSVPQEKNDVIKVKNVRFKKSKKKKAYENN